MLAVKVEMGDFARKLQQLAETPQLIRNAVVGALSDTVDDVHTRQTLEMKRVFNNPTSYVTRGLKKNYPGGREGTQTARARFGQGVERAGTYFELSGVGNSPEDIVKPHVFGGQRKQKRSERRIAGHGIPTGRFTVMGRDYPRNASGDINGARYTQMLNELGALSETARSAMPKSRQRNRKGVSYFLVRKGGVPVAIAERRGKRVTVMLAFAKSAPTYQKRYDHFGVGAKQVRYSLPLHFSRIVNRYISRMA
jgi:hypothetical protein